MPEETSEPSPEKAAAEQVSEQDEIRERFPDPETDPRLNASYKGQLPEVPEVNFKRPQEKTNRGFLPAGKNGAGAPPEEKAGEYRNMGIATTLGFSLVGSIGIGTLLGWLVDTYLLKSTGTPWGLIIGFFAGVISGFVTLIQQTNKLNQ